MNNAKPWSGSTHVMCLAQSGKQQHLMLQVLEFIYQPYSSSTFSRKARPRHDSELTSVQPPIMSMTLDEAQAQRNPRPVPATPSNVLHQFSMENKLTIITGASSGIGLAVAEGIAEAGGDLALWYNSNNAAIEEGEKLAKLHGIKVKAYRVEVTEPERVREAIAEVARDFGKIGEWLAPLDKVCEEG